MNTDDCKSLRPEKIRFDYLKSSGFRVVHVDGAVGGITPKGLISIAVYSERPPIPRQVVYPILDDKHLGDELLEQREIRDAIVRELEVDLMMDHTTARLIHEWLGKLIANIEARDPENE